MIEREKGRAHRKGIIGEASAVLEIIGEVVSAVVGLREDDDDVQLEVLKTLAKWRRRKLSIAVTRGGRRLVL
jgi:hypothetical protein